jgi:hypothetical protein
MLHVGRILPLRSVAKHRHYGAWMSDVYKVGSTVFISTNNNPEILFYSRFKAADTPNTNFCQSCIELVVG